MHFGDKPKRADAAKEVKIRPNTVTAPKSASDRSLQRSKTLKMFEDERRDRKELKEKQRKEKQKTKKECEKLKKLRKKYQRSHLLYDRNKDGSKSYLSEAERKKEEADLQKAIKKSCGKKAIIPKQDPDRR